MRFLLYNIRYGTGGTRKLPWSGYFRRTSRELSRITEFIGAQNPDIVGLIEVDSGSYRSRCTNQAETIAGALGHYHTYKSKYGESSWAHLFPMVNKQGNAFLTRDTIRDAHFHYFEKGMKRLVIELELENLTVFLVHLALTFRVRQHQLGDLYELVNGTGKPHIVAGDFNAFWGHREMSLFLAATGLANVNTAAVPTFPSWKPSRQLDFILCSPEITVDRFWIPPVSYSDHLPLLMDFNLRRS